MDGPGGLRSVLLIAFPMVVSSATEMLMMLIDRAFLSTLGPAHIAASGSGGLMAFMTLTFFIGVSGYCNALVAQHLGAGQKERCPLAATQGLIVGLCGYPVILCLIPAGRWLLAASGHDAAQQVLERQYYTILLCGSIITFVGMPVRSFFSGIGRTKVVMVASAVAMLANVGANYVLIFGKFGFPRLEMAGAAYGTVVGNAAGLLVLLAAYLRPRYVREFATCRSFVFDRGEFGTLLKFGTPSGVEFFLNLAAFNLFVQLFHSYGRDAAAAMTITFNWDMVAFLPMLGIHIATTSLVGRHMGAQDPATAERSAHSGMALAGAYAGVLSILFLAWPAQLVQLFARGANSADYAGVTPLATSMLRLAAVYTISDAVAMVFGGALRGAGDTHWCMRVSVLLHWTMALCMLVMIRVLQCQPLTVWLVFVLLVLVMGLVYYERFRRGHWKSIRVLAASSAEPPATGTSLPHAEQLHE